jgi:hypothetical protein
MTEINALHEFMLRKNDPRIKLLCEKEVLQWLMGDLSFLPPIESKCKTQDVKTYKVLEDAWGQMMAKKNRPDLVSSGQWTTKLGEDICKELQWILGHEYKKPIKINGFEPDGETEIAIWEAKAQTYFTDGTAGEKILGVPFKYADIPELYGKPLRILCMGRAEKLCREHYGNLPGPKMTDRKREMVEVWKKMGIEYVGATDILAEIMK